MKNMVKVVSILLMLGMITIGIHPILLSAENQNTNETIEMKVNVTERWENYYNAEIVITNVTEEKLDNWAVKFDYCDNIESIWNAKLVSHKEDSYVIKCLNWNQDIEAKGSVSFGITAKYDTEIGNIENVHIISDWIECEKEDYSISCRQIEQWNEGMSEEITIQNMSGDIIEDWCIEIVANVEIEKIWNAEIEDHYVNDEGKDVYLLKNATYNQNIPAGDNCTLGFIAKKKEQTAEIQASNLYYVTLCERTDSESTLDNENTDFENPMLIPPQDDFENYEEYMAYLTENVPMMLWSRAATYEASPLEKKERTVKQLYEIKGNIDIRKKAIQNFCFSGNNYAYGVQHRGKDAYLIRFLLTTNNSGKKIAKIQSKMELRNFGHTQSLERFEYKGQEYLLLTGTCSKSDKDFATEIICVKYVQGGEVNAKNCGKIKNLAYSNINKTNFGTIDRMDIGLQGTSKIVIWKRRIGNTDVQVSTITFSDKMKEKLAKGKVMNFNSYEDIKKSYRLTTFTMNRNTKNYILPDSMQSIDMEAGNNIYISSGRQPGIPLCIAQVGAVKGKYKTKYKLKFKSDFPIKEYTKEIEGVHCKGDELWFLIANSEKINVEENGENVKLKRQFICSINK